MNNYAKVIPVLLLLVAVGLSIDPTVNAVSPATGYQTRVESNTFTFNFTDDNSTANCTLYVNGVATAQNNASVTNNTNTAFTHSLSPSQTAYTWLVTCIDPDGGSGSSTGRTITILGYDEQYATTDMDDIIIDVTGSAFSAVVGTIGPLLYVMLGALGIALIGGILLHVKRR